MGKQIGFIMDAKDEQEFFNYLLSTGLKILFEGNNMNPIEITTLPEPFSGKGWFALLLYKEEFGPLTMRTLKDGRKYVEPNSSSVIEFDRTVIREQQNEISRGRLWYQTSYYDINENLVYKIEELDKMYKELCKYVKKNLCKVRYTVNERTYFEYCSESLKDRILKEYKLF